jgi:large subunit ribosomal protein L35
LPFLATSCIEAAFELPGQRAAVAAHEAQSNQLRVEALGFSSDPPTETSQMPKLKTKSGAKKRFKISATGKVIAPQANKRHGMIKRTKKQIRQQRGTTVMNEVDARHVRKIFMPYG